MGLWDEWGVLRTFSLVVATLILAVTERVGATFRRKRIIFFIMGYRRSHGYYYSRDNFFLLGA